MSAVLNVDWRIRQSRFSKNSLAPSLPISKSCLGRRASQRHPAGRPHERGLTQEELAARIRITRNYVGMIERQENSPTVAMLERIAKALGIEPARLFDEKAVGRKAEA
jgi:DNA-binding XRE family transcriptional regulator